MSPDRCPRLLDLFCGAGGAAKGYQRAGFYVVGVDSRPQPRYCGDEFVQADALSVLERGLPYDFYTLAESFDAIHASPPCQAFSAYRRKGHGVGDGYPDLIAPVRRLLKKTGLPWVIENIPGAPLQEPLVLCGSMFGLDVRRHRLFETSAPMTAAACRHDEQQAGRFPAATNRRPGSRATVEIGVFRIPLETQKRAMGVDWGVTLSELSQAIPPAYTEFVGGELRRQLAEHRSMSCLDPPVPATTDDRLLRSSPDSGVSPTGVSEGTIQS